MMWHISTNEYGEARLHIQGAAREYVFRDGVGGDVDDLTDDDIMALWDYCDGYDANVTIASVFEILALARAGEA